MNWKKQYQKALTFSYDDGNVQDKKLLDILNRYGMKCTFNVNTGLDFDHGTWVYRDVLEVHRLNLAECPELYAGHEMAVHGVYHYNLTELSPAELTAELQENAETITKLYGTAPVGMAYPYGVYNDTVIAELNRLGIRYARGVESSHSFAEQADLMRFQPTCHHDDPQLFDLAKQFLESEPETPQIFYTAMSSKDSRTGTGWNVSVRCWQAEAISSTAQTGKYSCRMRSLKRNERTGTYLLR